MLVNKPIYLIAAYIVEILVISLVLLYCVTLCQYKIYFLANIYEKWYTCIKWTFYCIPLSRFCNGNQLCVIKYTFSHKMKTKSRGRIHKISELSTNVIFCLRLSLVQTAKLGFTIVSTAKVR